MATFVKELVVVGGLIQSGTAAQVDSPDMVATGVTADSYTNANITVDAAGRITAASDGDSSGGGGGVDVNDSSVFGYLLAAGDTVDIPAGRFGVLYDSMEIDGHLDLAGRIIEDPSSPGGSTAQAQGVFGYYLPADQSQTIAEDYFGVIDAHLELDGHLNVFGRMVDVSPVPASGSGDGSGDGNATQLQGYAISTTAPTAGQLLQWNGSAWVPYTLPTTNRIVYTSPGSYNWEVPSGITGITGITVQCWGAGGGGQNASTTNGSGGSAGYGGGGGGYNEVNVTVTPSAIMVVTVGAGGKGGLNPTPGDSSSFGLQGGSLYVQATGGGAIGQFTTPNGGTGQYSGVINSGGKGGDPNTGNSGGGGGGGGSAGSSGDGGDGSSGTNNVGGAGGSAGSGNAGNGNGGDGGNSNGGDGAVVAIGAGGGGGGGFAGTNGSGSDGGNGMVILSW